VSNTKNIFGGIKMNKYEEGLTIIEESFGNGKDNVISLATIGLGLNDENKPRPAVRSVDAYYEDGVFYTITYATSNKMQQIAENSEASVSATFESESGQVWFTSNAVGENLGWVLDAKNAEIRTKLRKAFAAWYDFANDENDPNCCYLAIRLTKGVINKNHFQMLYHMDFINKTAEKVQNR